jgi:hypothetical protein
MKQKARTHVRNTSGTHERNKVRKTCLKHQKCEHISETQSGNISAKSRMENHLQTRVMHRLFDDECQVHD